MFTVAKRYRFSAEHTLQSKALSGEENLRVYGKCANPTGHGHDYAIEVLVSGENLIDDVVVGHGLLDDLVKQQLAPRLEYQNLNRTFGESFIPTGENLTAAVWRLLEPHLPQGLSLAVRIVETPKNAFVFRGEGEQSGRAAVE
jgi:6-pyruvoyltetrahydropterin/6-carboxytetrahydropterin synthase